MPRLPAQKYVPAASARERLASRAANSQQNASRQVHCAPVNRALCTAVNLHHVQQHHALFTTTALHAPCIVYIHCPPQYHALRCMQLTYAVCRLLARRHSLQQAVALALAQGWLVGVARSLQQLSSECMQALLLPSYRVLLCRHCNELAKRVDDAILELQGADTATQRRPTRCVMLHDAVCTIVNGSQY